MTSAVPLFTVKLRNQKVPSDELLADMRRVGHENGGVLPLSHYEQHGNHSASTIAHRFGSWGAALQAAGLPTNTDRRISDEELLENLANVWRTLGRQPLSSELVKAEGVSRFSKSTYATRFGSWTKALMAFDDFVNRGKQPTPRPGPAVAERASRRVSWRLRATVLIRDSCTCRMCGASPAKDADVTLHVDHITPWSQGGATALHNLQTLCSACNIGKSDQLCSPPIPPPQPRP
jgi:hypothetical protein